MKKEILLAFVFGIILLNVCFSRPAASDSQISLTEQSDEHENEKKGINGFENKASSFHSQETSEIGTENLTVFSLNE